MAVDHLTLVRVDVAGAARVVEVLVPAGLGRDLSRLFPMGDDRYGVCSWLGQTLSVVDVRASAITKMIRVPALHVSLVGKTTVTLDSPHGGQRMRLRRPDLEQLELDPMPTGTRPFLDGAYPGGR